MCKKYANICRNMQKEIYTNMQKYEIENMHEICKNMQNMQQKICNNIIIIMMIMFIIMLS